MLNIFPIPKHITKHNIYSIKYHTVCIMFDDCKICYIYTTIYIMRATARPETFICRYNTDSYMLHILLCSDIAIFKIVVTYWVYDHFLVMVFGFIMRYTSLSTNNRANTNYYYYYRNSTAMECRLYIIFTDNEMIKIGSADAAEQSGRINIWHQFLAFGTESCRLFLFV